MRSLNCPHCGQPIEVRSLRLIRMVCPHCGRRRHSNRLREIARRLWKLALLPKLIGLCCALLLLLIAAATIRVHQVNQQRDAVKAIRNAGGWVGYSNEIDEEGQFRLNPKRSIWPAQLVRALGKGFFDDVVYVEFNCDFDKSLLRKFQQLKQFKHLELPGRGVDDASLADIGSLKNLESLEIAATDVSDDGLTHLSGLAHLEYLDLSYTNITEAGLKQLSTFTRLERLRLIDTHVTKSGIDRLRSDLPVVDVNWSRAPSLKHRLALAAVIKGGGSVYNPFDYPDQAGYTLAIGLPWGDGKETHLTYLKSVADVTSLIFYDYNHLGVDGLKPLVGHTGIENLRFIDTPVNNTILEQLASFPNLRKLDLRGSEIEDDAIAIVARLSALRELDLDGNAISDKGLFHVSTMTKLESLGLADMRISDQGLRHLAKLTKLKKLDLDGTAITSLGLEHIIHLKHLNKLNLDRTAITDVGLEHIAHLKHLKNLSIRRTKVTSNGIRRLQEALTDCEIDDW